MIINKNTLRVNGQGFGQYAVEVNFDYHKLFDDKSGRNLAGTMVSKLVGIFPKITVQFRALTQTELELIAPILDGKTQSVQYYDPVKKANRTMTTYAGDWGVVQKNIGRVEGFSCAFISIEKRK